MDLIKEYKERYKLFYDLIGFSFTVYNEYRQGLLESAYEAALEYLLSEAGYSIQRQQDFPIYWKDIKLDQHYRMDLVIEETVIVELKAINFCGKEQERQLHNYMRLTHIPYGALINFGPHGVYSKFFHYIESTNECEPFKLEF